MEIKMTLYPFQLEGVNFISNAINQNGAALLGDEPGLGKSPQSIIYANQNNFKTLIFCPSYLKYNWVSEITKFTGKSSLVLDSSKPPETLSELDPYQFIIANYEISYNPKIYPFIYHTNFDLVIADESQYLKNHKTKRTQHTVAIVKKNPRKLFLTGTPVKSNPEEFYIQLHALRPDIFNDFGSYAQYCQKNASFESLHRLIKPFYLRRLKENVLPELPKLQKYVIPLQMSTTENTKYNSIFNVINKGNGEILTAIIRAKQFLADIKLNYVFSMIDNLIQQDQKVVVFSQHVNTLNYISTNYKNICAQHYGNLTPEERQLNVSAFQNNPNIKLLVANTMTAVGYTATVSSNAIFVDLPWTPADLKQATDRLHRIGQNSSVQIHIPLYMNSIDMSIYNLLEEKDIIVKKITNLKEYTDVKIQSRLISELRLKIA